jgi:hypothetical protein
MPTLHNANLSVITDRPEDRATATVSCDIEFTDVEVNAMDLLGLRYALSCRVLNKYLLDEDPVITYRDHIFPRVPGAGRHHEHVVFETSAPMYDLHDRLLGKDRLIAELTLRNEETRDEQKLRTDDISVDLAA